MKLNNESIYGTRPWKIFGEGPAQQVSSITFFKGKQEIILRNDSSALFLKSI